MDSNLLLEGLIQHFVGQAETVQLTIVVAAQKGLEMSGGDNDLSFHSKLVQIIEIAKTL